MNQLILFIRTFSVSAFIGICYLLILELCQYLLKYNDAISHSIVAFIFYVIGIYINYLMQKKLVFNAQNSPLKSFVVYNLVSALLVSSLSGVLYSSQRFSLLFSPYSEAASTGIALLLISPITFIVLKKIFKYSV